jgi:hypothetical protein
VSLPLWNHRIVAQSLAWLTGGFQQPNIRAWLAAIAQEMQEIEDATWGVLTMRFLATVELFPPVGSGPPPNSNDTLDVIGALVGQPRSGLDDADYQTLIFLRIAVNRAIGRVGDWAGFAKILLRAGAGGPVSYYEAMAGLFFGVWNLPQGPYPTADINPNIVAQALAQAVPNGVNGIFAYSTWPDGDDFEWCDVNNVATTGQGGWGDSVAGQVGGLLVSGIGI